MGRKTIDTIRWSDYYEKVGSVSVKVLVRDGKNQVLICIGTTAPTDADDGFAAGALFIDTDTGKLYINVGTAASANFDALAMA